MNKSARPDKQTLTRSDAPNCEIHCPVHLDNLRQVQPELLPMAKAQRMAELFGVADPNCSTPPFSSSQELCTDLAAGENERISCLPPAANTANYALS